MKFLLNRYVIGSMLGLLFMLGVRTINGALHGREREARHQQLVDQFRTIPTVPGGVVKSERDHYSRSEPGPVAVGADYHSNLPNDEVQEYYDKELTARGWEIVGRNGVEDWGRPTAATETHYCKDGLAATLWLRGRPNEYSIDFSWGLGRCS
jgi:hypothetical protein